MRRIVVGAARDNAGAEQMRFDFADGCDFRPVGVAVGAFSATMQIMGADVMAFEASAVDGPLGFPAAHLQGLGAIKNSVEQTFKSPFFSSRRSA